MSVEVGVIRGASTEEILNRKFNFYLGISLGNKWFVKENILEYLLWSLKYTKGGVAVLIADRLHAVNYEVRNGYSLTRALQKALRKGDEIERIIMEIIGGFSEEERLRIKVLRWNFLESNAEYLRIRRIVCDHWEKNPAFRREILAIVRNAIPDPERYSDEEIGRLANYVLGELPVFLVGIQTSECAYTVYPYPVDTLLNKLVEKIQKKEIFPELGERIGEMPNVFVELKVFNG
jgi:tRNA-dependent cyclodipeptide synthase